MKKKKIWVILVVCAVLTCLAVSALIFYRDTRRQKYANMSGITIANRNTVITSIREGLKNHSRQIIIEFTAHNDSMADVGHMVDALMEQALSETDDASEGDYIRYQYGGYEVRYGYNNDRGRYDYIIKIIPEYYTTPAQEEEVTEEVHRILDGFAFDESTDDYEKVRAIYDYVYQNVCYDKVHQNKDNQHLKTTAYAALHYGTAVCQGYSVLMYRLLKESGVDARVITGTGTFEGQDELHAWNLVKIDGRYYNLDVTWDKALESDIYFLKGDADFPDHVRDEKYTSEEFCREYPCAEQKYVNE